MKAVVFQGVGDVRLEEAPEPPIQEPFDATSAICGTDLHLIRGTTVGVVPPRAGWARVSLNVSE